MTRHFRFMTFALILVLLATVVATGCRGKQSAPPAAVDLSKTMVPNVDLDAYVYVRQDGPTKIPARIIGASSDLMVESAALWGIARTDGLAVAGALTLSAASDAKGVQSQIPASSGVWTAVADRTIYFVRGSGPEAETFKTAISKNDFKYYNDSNVLAELALLPNGANNKPAAVAIVKPNQTMAKLASVFGGQQAGSIFNTLVSYGQLQSTIGAIYAPGQINVAELYDKMSRGNMWESEIGALAAIKSGLPGPILGPIATNYLTGAGFTRTTVNGVDVFRGNVNVGGKSVPVLMTIEGSRIYAAVSGKDAYAQSLLTGIKR